MSRILQIVLWCILVPCAVIAQQQDNAYWTELEARVRTNTIVHMVPVVVTNLPICPTNWGQVRLDTVSLHLPFEMINSVTNSGSLHIQFQGPKKFCIHLVLGRGLKRLPVVPFAEVKSAQNILIKDLDAASPERRNEILSMLESKATKPSGTYETYIVETPTICAFVMKSQQANEEEQVHITTCDLHSPDGKSELLMLIRNEPDKEFPFKLLSGISFTGSTMRHERIIADIQKIRQHIESKRPNKPAQATGKPALGR